MQFTMNVQTLLEGLNTVTRALAARPAKPVLDILVGVDDVRCAYDFEEALKAIDIRVVGEANKGQIMCDKLTPDGLDTVHIHFAKYESPEWYNYIRFRDYLNTFPEEAKRYADLKLALLERFANDRPSYTQGKIPLITELLQKANAWAVAQNN